VYLIERAIKHRWPRSHPGFVSLFVLFYILLTFRLSEERSSASLARAAKKE
jgi:hypothetical protein